MTHDFLRQLHAAKRLLAQINRLIVSQRIDVHHGCPDIHHGDNLIPPAIRQQRLYQLEGILCSKRVNVHHRGFESHRLRNRHPVFDFFLSGRGNQDLNILRAVGRGTQDLEVQVDLLQRKRNVLVGFCFDLGLELIFGLAGRHDNFLGDNRRGRQSHRQVLGARTHSLPPPANGVPDFLQIHDVAVNDGVLGQRFNGVPLKAIFSFPARHQLHHFHRRRTDVDADHRR